MGKKKEKELEEKVAQLENMVLKLAKKVYDLENKDKESQYFG
ncbi:hypothetical protein M948_20640 [Virgibacillus sp. CM-4]|uniref:Uncharacterized protein n=1 Tax=Virgibacillus massiliensis TaxID=1462526 RepID=A0A024QH53_9BACI|nr:MULTISPECIES: hypothetical protein [Virgibacillus]EQB34792.1 hypothetical protein M948_20640 [Virgibacillus sp. CM-4]CDQ41500.1 hypothetical protein BN990_03873 [Virgibacillus massiliensis]